MLVGLSRMVKICLIISILASASLLAFYLIFETYRSEDRAIPGRHFRLIVNVTYENRGGEIWSLRKEDLVVGLFMNNSWQIVYLEDLSHPVKEISRDTDGNPVMLLDIKERIVPPNDRVSYRVAYRLVYRERKLPSISEGQSGTLDDIPEHLKSEYCKPTPLWQSNIPMLREAAQRIAGNETKVLSILKNLIRWIARNINYKTSEIPRYPNETFSQRLGDCDDQANLLIAFCRSINIPAYLQIGCIYIPYHNKSLSYWSGHLLLRQVRIGWHGWAVVYVPPWGWLPVDLTYVEGDIALDPLNAITRSAIIEHYTFQYMNITVTDYIAETKSLKEFLEGNEFYIHEEDVMEVIGEISFHTIFLRRIIFLMILSPSLLLYRAKYANNLYTEAGFEKYTFREWC